MSKTIVVLASGAGSNFESIVNAIEAGKINATIRCLIVDRPCGATKVAKKHGISYYELAKSNDSMLNLHVKAMLCHEANLIVCAGYLSILGADFVHLFQGRILNIHPSLLPKYGGKGMYGLKVHQAVLDAGEEESGCSVHLVDGGIDTGTVLAQAIVSVSPMETAESLQQKVQQKEHELLPQTIQNFLQYQQQQKYQQYQQYQQQQQQLQQQQ